jgi:hypothetical protein
MGGNRVVGVVAQPYGRQVRSGKLGRWRRAAKGCSLHPLKNPGAYDHKLIEVSGKASRGFEDFTLSNGCHLSSAEIWLDFGGTKGAQVVYCCGNTEAPQREKRLVIDGIATTLVQDTKFEQFRALTRGNSGSGGEADATLIGWFFSGTKQVLPGGTRWMGYGHMGFYSLLVIQQVVAVSKP